MKPFQTSNVLLLACTSFLVVMHHLVEIDAFTAPLSSTTVQGRLLVARQPFITHCRKMRTSTRQHTRQALFFQNKEEDEKTPKTGDVSEEEVSAEVNGEEGLEDSLEEESEEKIESKESESVKVEVKEDITAESTDMNHSKLTRLKDKLWVRETLEDLTSAEFACSLSPSKDRSKRGVDFENIASQLARRIEEMCIKGSSDDAACIAFYPLTMERDSANNKSGGGECLVLRKNAGMGSVTYSDEQRDALLQRLLVSRENIIEVMEGKITSIDTGDLDDIREALQTNSDSSENVTSSSQMDAETYLYVREDGTVDWDGALQDRAALQKFGTSVWARINGQNPEMVDEVEDTSAVDSHEQKQVTAKIIETDAIREKKKKLDELRAERKELTKQNTALLNSAVSAGSAVANVNLALLEPELRSEIRNSNKDLEKKNDEVSFQTLNYELEQIYTYLDGELGNTATKGYIPLQDRLNVAEFGLLESQFEAMNTQISNGIIVDSDILAVVVEQSSDLKRRLGIDYYVAGLTFDQEAIKIWLNDLLQQSKKGLAFYGKGVQLFSNDVIFSISLIGKALQGYTLKPREVRTLRRTFKDVITFIPVVIILIIPLTPVGHVFVFGAIQRFFPDFFPSCFTERRQNLLSLYETAEFSKLTIDENWQEKIVRTLGASAFVLADNAKKIFSDPATDGESGSQENK